MEKNLKFLISSILVALCFLVPQKTQAMELVEKVYDPKVTYSHGLFEYHQEGATFSTLPMPRAQEIYKQKAFIYEKAPQELKREKVLMKVIPGKDGRGRVLETDKWPHRICTQITMVFNGEAYGGSGCLVGPHHILTAGHNVYDDEEKTWAEKISVYPALDDNSAPFGEAQVVKAVTFKGWISEGNSTFDMALLVLNKSIGKYTGWGGLLSDDETKLSQETVHITGYPADKGLKQMWSMSHKIKTVKPEQFDYEIDTYRGQSGSPIWINNRGIPMILGVHTCWLKLSAVNSGVRLSTRKFTDFVDIISKTYVLNSNTNTAPPPPLPIPPIAQGYEEIYKRFLKGVLIYRPQEGSDIGRIDMPIAALANPLEGTFDLLRCGDAAKHLSISTGYQKAKKAENVYKLEIWIAPRFLISKGLTTTAKHFQRIMGNWRDAAPIGIFWNWGRNEYKDIYESSYLTKNMDELSNNNLADISDFYRPCSDDVLLKKSVSAAGHEPHCSYGSYCDCDSSGWNSRLEFINSCIAKFQLCFVTE